MNRVVSLLPSSTKIICALGCGERLVGRSQECDYPPGVGDLPACTAPKFDPDGTSYQIDQRVKVILQEAVSVYRVDAILYQSLPVHSCREIGAAPWTLGKPSTCPSRRMYSP